MPTYDYKCGMCNKIEEHTHMISESPEYKCECGAVMAKQFTLNTSGFIFKGSTEAINWREKRIRLAKSEKLMEKQRNKALPKLKPNIAGVEVDSWSDAKKMAKEAGLNHESYTPYVEKEKKPLIL